MRRDTRLSILGAAGVIALGAYVWRPAEAPRPAGQAPRAPALEAAVAEIEAGRQTTPLIGEPTAAGDATVTFLARRAGDREPRIVSDVTGWGEHADGTFDFTIGKMTRVGRTDWYSLQATVAPGARIEYLVAYAPTDYRVDPSNPRQSGGPPFGGARASEFVMPGYVPPPEFASPPAAPAGQTTEASLDSPSLGRSCRLFVYTPPGYRADGAYPVAVFLDLRSEQVSRVIDWLIARQAIEPIVAAFVGSDAGSHERFTGAPLRAFLTDELLTWLASRYGVSEEAGRRAVIGVSFGAKDALDAALGCARVADAPASLGCRSDAFGRLGLLIPGRRIVPADIDTIAERSDRRVRVAILAARYDRANAGTARSLRQALADAGHVVDYMEVPEGHSAVTWITHLSDVLAGLYGSTANAAPERQREQVPAPRAQADPISVASRAR